MTGTPSPGASPVATGASTPAMATSAGCSSTSPPGPAMAEPPTPRGRIWRRAASRSRSRSASWPSRAPAPGRPAAASSERLTRPARARAEARFRLPGPGACAIFRSPLGGEPCRDTPRYPQSAPHAPCRAGPSSQEPPGPALSRSQRRLLHAQRRPFRPGCRRRPRYGTGSTSWSGSAPATPAAPGHAALRRLAGRAVRRRTRLPRAHRPADLRPLAGALVVALGDAALDRRAVGAGAARLLLPVLGDDAAGGRDRPAGRPGHLHRRGPGHRPAPAPAPAFWAPAAGRHRAGARSAVDLLSGLRPDRDRRLRTRQDLGRRRPPTTRSSARWSPTPPSSASSPGCRCSTRRHAGVKAVVVCYTGMPDDEVANQYNPFITPYPSASGKATPRRPGLPRGLGRRGHRPGAVAQRARPGRRPRTLTLTADITAGRGHRDAVGRAARLERHRRSRHRQHPHRRPERHRGERRARHAGAGPLLRAAAAQPATSTSSLVTGHFQLPQFTAPIAGVPRAGGGQRRDQRVAGRPSRPRRARRRRRHRRAPRLHPVGQRPGVRRVRAAGRVRLGSHVHLPAQRFDGAGRRGGAGLPGRGASGEPAGRRNSPVATLRPGAVPLYLGEGAPLYAAGLGTVSLVPLPPYLLQAGTRQHPRLLNLEQLDRDLAYAQILTLERTIRALDATPTAAL